MGSLNSAALIAAMRSGLKNQPASLAKRPMSNQTSLVGDRQLPVEGRTITPIQGVKGGYDVSYGGNSVGQLLRGGPNGQFHPSGAAPIPSVTQPYRPPPMTPQMQPPGVAMQLGGGGGGAQLGGMPGMQPQRQYTPNPFQQQMITAQRVRNGPIMVGAPTPRGGLQYG